MRIIAKTPVDIHILGTMKIVKKAMITDMSAGGVCIITNSRIPEGTKVKLHFNIQKGPDNVNLTGKVLHCEEAVPNEIISIGMSTKETPLRERRRYCGYISKMIDISNNPPEAKDERIQKAANYIKANFFSRTISDDEIASKGGLCKTNLIKFYKKEFGCTPRFDISRFRVEKAIKLMNKHPEKCLPEIAELVGYKDIRSLDKAAVRHTKQSISVFKIHKT